MLKIKAERLKRGWSQMELGHRARLQPSEVSRIETGKAQPYPNQAKRLAKALKLEPDQLLESVEA